MKTFDDPGRARKQCPQCSKYIGAAGRICICGFVFKNKDKPKPKTIWESAPRRSSPPQEKEEVSSNSIKLKNYPIIRVPAGKPKWIFNYTKDSEIDSDALIEWAENMIAFEKTRDQHQLSVDALSFYLFRYCGFDDKTILVAEDILNSANITVSTEV